MDAFPLTLREVSYQSVDLGQPGRWLEIWWAAMREV